MSKTSTEVKRRYNSKTYKRWSADLRFEDFDKLESMRGALSRAAFIKELIKVYEESGLSLDTPREAGE